ncbi:MAG: DsbA family protein [archaeon]
MEDNKPKEDLMAEHRESVQRNRTKRATFWKVSTVILLILLVLVVYTKGIPTGFSVAQDDAAVEKALAFINENLLMGIATAQVTEVSVERGMYKLDLSVTGDSGVSQEFTSYVTKDGDLLFPSVIDMTEFEYVVEEEQTEEETTMVDFPEDPSTRDEAKVTIVEFSDFECPFCSKAYETVKEVEDLYGEDIKIVFKNFPLGFHENAQKAAEAGECANDQGKFWEMHDKMFENQEAITVEDLKAYAEELELDTETFNTCLDSGEKAEEVAKDVAEGTELGVSGTPAFFINGKSLVGAQPLESFQAIIDVELAEPEEVIEEVPEVIEEVPEVTACEQLCIEEGFTTGICREPGDDFCQEGEELKGTFNDCGEGSLERCCCITEE